MEYTFIIILIALLQYLFFVGRTGFSREKYGVKAPKTAGHDVWERIFRVQQNTMEQLIIFIPGMLLFSQYVGVVWALIPGLAFVIGRQIYSHLYVKDPASRGPGMIMSFFANIALVIGSLIGIGISLLSV
jgi:glutathione S-transferase